MWTCPKCLEENDDDAEVCWSCGTTAQGKEDPGFQRADDAGPDREGEEPLVDVLPRTNVPEALQPRQPPPVGPRRRQPARCPNCGSRNVAGDSASPWLVIGAMLLITYSGFLVVGEAQTLGAVCLVLGIVLLILGLLVRLCTDNAWCRDCGVRFKRVDRPERLAQQAPPERDGPADSGSRPLGK